MKQDNQSLMPTWWKWKTRQIQVLVSERMSGFKSRGGYHYFQDIVELSFSVQKDATRSGFLSSAG